MTTTVKNRRLAARLTVTTALSAGFLALTGAAALAQAVVVQGNRRVDAETIRGYASRGGSPEEIRRELQGSGLFADVRVSRRGSQTVISVRENDSVNNVAFEGNRRLKSDFLTGEMQSRSRGPISESLIQADMQKIRDLYRRAGYGNTTVSYRIVPLPNGRSDIVYTIAESSKTGVVAINFSGNTEYGSGRLKGLMSTTEMNLLSWIKTSDVYDPDKIAADLELVRRFYLRNGYADFQIVSSNATFSPERGGWIVDVVVSEGPRYTVRSVDVQSRLRDVDGSTLRRVVSTNEGDWYNAEAVERSLAAMTVEVGRRGFPFTQVRPQGARDPGSRTVSISYVVDEGPRVYVERINIRGNTRTMDNVIRREFDLGEGDPYNKVLIDRAERRLNNLGYFNRVRVTNEPGSAPDRVVVNVDVEDKATGSFSIAGGYSTTDGFIGDVSLSEANFLGRGQFVRIGGTLGQRARSLEFSFTEPFFMGQRIAAGFDVFTKFQDNSTTSRFESRTTGGTIRATLPITEEFSITPRYSLFQTEIKVPNKADKPYNDCLVGAPGIANNSISAGLPSTVIAGTPDCIANGEASVAVKEAAGKRLTSLAGLTLIYNSLDNVQVPRNGFYAELRPEVAGLGGDSKYWRVSADARYYREVMDDVIGIFRLQGGHTAGLGENLRIIDHTFMGPALVRGFATSGIGPRDASNAATARTGALGGTTYFGGSLEFQFPIPIIPKEIGIRGAVFADAGTLFNFDGGRATALGGCPAGTQGRSFDVNRNGVVDGLGVVGVSEIACVRDKNIIRSSVGASILWNSPLGPIRFDYAHALSYDKGVNLGGFRYGGDRLQEFRFSGGARF
jgi:outer membrane protein insertion porin family